MRNDVKLFINDELVDFSNELSIPFVYQLEDTNNPSIIKNSFTKSISIKGTKQNNKIFGDIYNFDREQLYDNSYLTGVYFNPSYRTPFTIYRDGELIEQGYMQLNTITLKNKEINYDVTLYGGLGDFFYSLSYNKDSESLTLADLKYSVRDEQGAMLDVDKEFDFTIDKDLIKKSWENGLGTGNETLTDFIKFVPCYNGTVNGFDHNKALINLVDNSAFTQSSTSVDDKFYTEINGYSKAEWEKSMTEWEVRDLRSYHQRPAIKVKKVIDACCNPDNNGGYVVELDNTFFNKNNPYYEQSYIALPLFESMFDNEGSDGDIITSDCVTTPDKEYIGEKDGVYNQIINVHLNPQGEEFVDTDLGYFDTSNFNFSTFFSAEIDIQILFKTNTTKELYQSVLVVERTDDVEYYDHPIYQSITAQIYVYGDNGLLPVARSKVFNFTNKLQDGSYSNPYTWTGNTNTNSTVSDIFGKFEYDKKTGYHFFKGDGGGNTFRITIDNIRKYPTMKFVLVLRRESNDPYGENNSSLYAKDTGELGKLDGITYNGWWDINTVVPKITAKWENDTIGSGQKITKQILLKTENTPADYLLSYCKLFNLHFIKEIGEKKIKILTRDNYFTKQIIDWDSRIDYSKDVKINPIIFNKKFYSMGLNSPDNYYLKKYKNNYSVDYGQKRINTAYNFNSETQPIFDDNVFENSISVLDSSIYYRSFFNSENVSIPPFTVEGIKYQLFDKEDGEYKTTDIEINDMADLSKTVSFNAKTGYDIFPKPSFFKVDNDKKTLSDISNTLLFYIGDITPTDINGNIVNYWITDDIVEMGILNDSKPCYIYTESEFNKKGERIAHKVNSIPQFSRYNIIENTVVNSWDFAVPKEMFIPNINYDDTKTIYNRFWSDFYNDQLSVNTKKITCNVNLQGVVVNDELLRKFYWFGNSLWILNKIDNYDINSNNTTKCEFIKVQEQYNYLKPLGF